ncbi:cytochrome-c oxidase, cbb3-type subunit I [Cytophagaceae bacterium DM2B3-1]|uniref:cytochrome-c oxidase n=1 Tax=Xanthocytophaga flava TaxID=3048013 RepID=A0ABT7CG13_9BACT|nr:cytochrome-c oxidase, cbb3-type subunit I [Xanthocytophaga flavus]MDJ1466683.1 cytochrome-c oxidase, cbb3-type subunit I [Xanthocytophaga flavus]MDJ1492679.1 cytochrome-c oxidase, cbb3-type subunit I [Xanthocytophaga flavus]
MQIEHFHYDNKIVRNFGIATMIFGVVGMLVGVTVAFQLVFPQLNFGIPYTSFGRLRPLHTNAIIFAFVGNAIFMGIYHSLQRLCKARMFSDLLSQIHFWGWQAIIAAAAITLPLGMTSSKEYAELEWPIDIAITLIWVVFGVNMLGTILKRRERHIYVAIWFYIATWVTVALLHIVNSFEMPVSFFKSYSAYAGVQDALVQWWYGHNAVAFFLTTPFLGLMYYYLPKMSNRPVYSYKLSILHFWTLIFIYIWAGPHHLLYSSLPDWVQSLGVVFSIMLIAPSWGGGINGLLTLRGAWDKVREDIRLKFMVVAITAYLMATFEGPLLSLKNVNAIAHFTDWIVAHVHVGGLGWNGFMVFAILYYLVPKMWQTEVYSKKLMNFHFWIGTLGILFYAIPMYWAGFTAGLMWKDFNPDGTLQYPNFLESVTKMIPFYALRGIGGVMYLSGTLVMIYNLWMTARQGTFLANEAASAPALETNTTVAGHHHWHKIFERKPLLLTAVSLVVVAIGGMIQIIPMLTVDENIPTIASVKPYTALELEGRDLYIREGCVSCHTQLVRPFRSETERYGEFSKSGEYIYDHPFLWGSKRTGPDLQRVGKKYPDSWHYHHMRDPESMSPGSIMPKYEWLLENPLSFSLTKDKLATLRKVGVPYTDEEIANAETSMKEQAKVIVDNLQKQGVKVDPDKEIVAMIAYLQRLGTDIKNKEEVTLK